MLTCFMSKIQSPRENVHDSHVNTRPRRPPWCLVQEPICHAPEPSATTTTTTTVIATITITTVSSRTAQIRN